MIVPRLGVEALELAKSLRARSAQRLLPRRTKPKAIRKFQLLQFPKSSKAKVKNSKVKASRPKAKAKAKAKAGAQKKMKTDAEKKMHSAPWFYMFPTG